MKKIIYTLCLTSLAFIGCKKEVTNDTKIDESGLLSNVFNTKKDYVLIGEMNHVKGHFSHLLSNMGLLTKSDGSGITTCGDVFINNSKLPDNSIDLNSQYNYLSWFDKLNTISFAGNNEQNFEAVSQQIKFVKPLKLISPEPKDILTFDLNNPLELKWVADNIEDDMLLEIRSCVLPTTEQKQEGVIGYYTTLLKDNGVYSIPAELLSTFNLTQGLHITIYRFTNDEVKSGDRVIDFITYSSYSGLFRFQPSL